MQNVDIAIIGAGSAGLTLALLLAPLSLQIALIEQQDVIQPKEADFSRVSALNLASQRVLAKVGAWEGIAASAAAYQHMSVWEADSFARIHFDAEAVQLPVLGWICDNEQIRQHLYRQLRSYSNVHCYFNSGKTQIHQSEREVLLTLADNTLILSRLLVGADGVNSVVRQQLQMPLTHWDYDQHAIVATIQTEEPHQNTARQVFLAEGPLALLPLPDSHQCSIVWSTSPARAEQLLAADETTFNKALTAASQSALGMLTLQNTRQVFPLKMRYASEWVRGRTVLVADAAHSIHPLAGQGMNLGLMDVASLAELIANAVEEHKGVADTVTLRRYERWRKAEAQSMILAMESFKRGFSNNNLLLKLLRTTGMSAVARLPWLKKHFINIALGNKGDLPQIARSKVNP